MFVALRDLKSARGRFVLMSLVIVLITFLVTFLASLTAGLARESTSAVTDLPADHIAFSMPAQGDAPDFTTSRVSSQQWANWARVDGVESAIPLGVATTRAESGSGAASVTAFGVEPGSGLVPGSGPDVSVGNVVLTRDAADTLGVRVGDSVTMGRSTLTVGAVTDTGESFSHTPVVWTTLDDWQSIGARGSAQAGGTVATAVALRTSGVGGDVLSRADGDIGTTTVTTSDARKAVASFAGENTSLTTMQAFLLAISALVVGAFFTVWTISRSDDVAVLKALGASTIYLLRDALGQAAILLIGGVVVGTALTALGASVLPHTVPVMVTISTTVVPAAGLIILGLLGAAVSIARITRVDPHAALASR